MTEVTASVCRWRQRRDSDSGKRAELRTGAEMGQNASDPCLIGIDCGTQSIRAIAFDRAGRKLAAAARPTPIKRSDSGGEYDPEAIFAAAVASLREVAGMLAGRPVAGMAVASIGESCVLVDESGKATAPS